MGTTSNQALIREVNEVVAASYARGEWMEVLCECGQQGCSRLVAMLRDDYDAVKEEAGRFIVCREHRLAGPERVVAEHPGFDLVEPAQA